jgi:hypothetical protein
LLATALPLAAQNALLKDRSGGVALEITSPFSHLPEWGFVPLAIAAENGGTRDLAWDISFDNYSSFGNTLRLNRRFVRVASPAGQAVAATPMVAVAGTNYDRLRVTARRDGAPEFVGTGEFIDDNGNPLWLATPLAKPAFEGRQSPGNVDLASLSTTHAPADWRAYAGFRGLAISPAEWRELAPGARLAILDRVRLGGDLFVTGDTGELAGLPPPDPGTGNRHSLGRIFSPAQPLDKSGLNESLGARAISGTIHSGWRERDRQLFSSRRGGLGALMMVGVALVFGILVGPVNFFVLAPAKRRHRLFFTTPLLSLGASGLLVAAVFLGDGLGGKGLRYLHVENRPGDGEHRNLVTQFQYSRCGALLGTAFNVPEDAWLAPIRGDSGFSRSEAPRSLEIVPGGLAGGGWFASRESQGMVLQSVRPTRGRLELGGTADAPVLTSTFDFALDSVYCRIAGADGGERIWRAGRLDQGRPTPLTETDASTLEDALQSALAAAPVELATELPILAARPGHFIALAGTPPGIPTHPGIRWTDHAFVTGPLVTP